MQTSGPGHPSGSGRVDLTAPQPGPIAIGRNIAGYELIKKLGPSQSTVFLARSPQGTAVALKILPQQVVQRSPSAGKRFLREARALFGLSHPNVVRLLDAGEELGTYYLAMAYFDGPTLKEVLAQRGRLDEAQTLRLGAQLARGLAYLHEQGLVHRNVKPEHLLVNAQGEVKLIGLGLLRESEDEGPNRVTMKGAILGSPQYMAPEQARGLDLDHRADLYSLGVTLYELASGTVPFPDKSAARVLQRLATDLPPPLRDRNPTLSAAIEAVVGRLLAKDPGDRYPDAERLAEDLEALGRGATAQHLEKLTGGRTSGEGGGIAPTSGPVGGDRVLSALVLVLIVLVAVLIARGA
ncbi:MAG: serine/threonine-protein kinase [Planctomycetota bacterium]